MRTDQPDSSAHPGTPATNRVYSIMTSPQYVAARTVHARIVDGACRMAIDRRGQLYMYAVL